MSYVITGSGVIDLRGFVLDFDGLTFNTSGNATAQVLTSQFGLAPNTDPGDVSLQGTITGNQFANTLEFNVNDEFFSAALLNFSGWSSNDRVIFRGPSVSELTGTTQNDFFQLGGSHVYGGYQNLDGQQGDDTMVYGGGHPRFQGGTGFDTLIADFSFAASVGLSTHNLAADASGYSGLLATGGWYEGTVGFGNVDRFEITGTKFDDILNTGDNADTVSGGAGNDYINTGKGTDIVDGGAGTADKWVADKSADGAGKAMALNTRTNAYSGPGFVTNIESVELSLGAGNDRIVTSVGALNDTILGGGGNDTVSLAQGEDRFEGGAGIDTLIADFSGATTFGLGFDLAADTSGYSGQFFTSGRYEGAVVFTGVDRFNIRGTQVADNIVTGGNADLLHGESGNDTLNGGGGADTMNGGRGSDIYFVDNTRDVTNETVAGAAGGVDTVYSQVSRTLGANIENLVLEGTAVAGTGNTGANVITGNALDNKIDGGDGNDTLDGGAGADELRGGLGADSMTGGLGSDRYFVDNANDVIVETTADLATGGNDTVYSLIDYTLGANLEILRLQGSAGLSAAGNQLNNRVSGNSGANLLQGLDGNDVLEGKDGADTLVGGTGNDTMAGGAHADVFRFASSNTGVDTITDFSRNFDRFDLSGGSFTALSIAPNGDAVLTHAGGAVRVQNPPNLTLAQWNALVLPGGSAADAPVGDALHDHAAMMGGLGLVQAGSLDWAFS